MVHIDFKDSVLYQLWVHPIVLLLIVLQTVLYVLSITKYPEYLDRFAFVYEKIVNVREWWRLVTCAFFHGSFLHLAFNMSSFYALTAFEDSTGSICALFSGVSPSDYFSSSVSASPMLMVLREKAAFLAMMTSLTLLCGVATYLLYHSAIHHTDHLAAASWMPKALADRIASWDTNRYYSQPAVGFSCVLFALQTITVSLFPRSVVPMFGFFNIPAVLSPFVSLLIIQIIVPNASLLGHLAGILVGFLYGFGVVFGGCSFLGPSALYITLAISAASVSAVHFVNRNS
eukprot:ANDGO_02596.mRNA.1 RHOMBOID-like protein 13